MPTREEIEAERLEVEEDREKVARRLLAEGVSPRMVARRTGLSIEQVGKFSAGATRF